ISVMDHRLMLLFLSLTTVSSLAASTGSWNDNRYRDYDYNGGRYEDAPRGRNTKGDDYVAPGAIGGGSHTYQSRIQCDDLCVNICSTTTVYLGEEAIPMYSCDKLKPPKVQILSPLPLPLSLFPSFPLSLSLSLSLSISCSFVQQASPLFFQTLKGNSFYLSLFIIGLIVVGILVLITMCFCCSYCCRNPSSAESSRGSSKQALAHNEDGEFKEYLNGNGNGNGNSLSNGHHLHEEIGAVKRERDFTRRPRPLPQIV
ncbi:hypothetical protein PENTCL1PPCAC_27021, partial [Pristionchus entomophagus]